MNEIDEAEVERVKTVLREELSSIGYGVGTINASQLAGTMARAAIKALHRWQPIETAPRGRDDMIDVWCVPFPGDDFKPSRGGIRLTDVFWHDDKSGEGWARLLDDGNIDFVEMRASQPGGLPPWKPTHWHPQPAPPVAA